MTKVYRPISAVLLAASIAGAVSILPSLSDQVVASAPIHSGKGDRLDARPIGINCSERAWPYFEAGCIRDGRSPLAKVNAARIVSADRTGF